MERRKFLKSTLISFFKISALSAFAYPVASFLTFRKAQTREVVFAQSDMGAEVTHKEGVFLIGKGDSVKALSAKCSHLGCLVNYNPITRRLECPCHGSLYDISGKKLKGPTTKDLEELPLIRNQDGSITVPLKL